MTIALGRPDVGARLIVADDLRLPREHARASDLFGGVPAARIASDRVVSLVAKRAAGGVLPEGVLPEDGEGSPVFL